MNRPPKIAGRLPAPPLTAAHFAVIRPRLRSHPLPLPVPAPIDLQLYPPRLRPGAKAEGDGGPAITAWAETVPEPPAGRGDRGKALPFTTFAVIDVSGRKDWIIKGVLANGEASGWIGPPGALKKSSLMAEFAVHAAAGWDWRGHRSRGPRGVVYFALERGHLTRRRLAAYRARFNLPELPIAVVSRTLDLMDPTCIETIVETVRAAEAQFQVPVGLIIIDTIAKGISAGGGDEDKARDKGKALANLRRVQDAIPVHTAMVGHTGKDEDRGSRGSNADMGDFDMAVQIRGRDIKVATITKANDRAEGELARFRGVIHDFGPDEDGDPITTNILDPEFIEGGEPEEVGAAARKSRLTGQNRIAFDALVEALLSHGREPPFSEKIPEGVKVVDIEEWRAAFYSRTPENPDAQRQAFNRARKCLQGSCRIGVYEALVWVARDA